MESARAGLSRAMRVHATEQSTAEPDDVILCVKPQGLRANRDFTRGEMCLVPYVGMAYITHNPKNMASVIDSGHTAKIDGRSVKLWISRPSQPSNECKR